MRESIGIYCDKDDELLSSLQRALKEYDVIDIDINSINSSNTQIKLLISCSVGFVETFSKILQKVRYRRFDTYPILFITTEQERTLRWLCKHFPIEAGFGYGICNRGSYYLKAPFTLNDLKNKIQEAVVYGGINDEELDLVLHCHEKCVLELTHLHPSEEGGRDINIIEEVLVIDDEASEWCEILKSLNRAIKFTPCQIKKGFNLNDQNGLIELEGKKIYNYDLILLDLYFDGKPEGEKLLKEFETKRKQYAYIPPIVILTGLYDPEKAVKLTMEGGATDYLYKPHLRKLSEKLPKWSNKIRDDLGLARFIKNSQLKAAVMSVKRVCEHEPDRFWYGDKVTAMVDHSKAHTMDVWQNLNKWISPIFKERSDFLSDEELYVLLMAVLLHDIGHKGDGEDIDPVVLRKKHGIVSERLIGRSFEKRGEGDEKKPNPYGFRDLCEIPAEAWARAVGLICKYHRGQAPLTKEQQEEWKRGELYQPDIFEEFFKSKSLEEAWEQLGEKEVWKGIGNNEKQNQCAKIFGIGKISKRPQLLAALLMFADATDVHKNRVVSKEIRDARNEVLNRDGEVYVKQFQGMIDDHFAKLRQVPGINSRNFSIAKDEIKRLFSGPERFATWLLEKESQAEAWYRHLRSVIPLYDQTLSMLAEYISFLKGQSQHYDKHLAVNDIEFETSSSLSKFSITVEYYLDQDVLLNMIRGEKEQGEIEKIIGNKITSQIKSDLKNEWNRCKKVLEESFSWDEKEGVKFFVEDSSSSPIQLEKWIKNLISSQEG